jgi:hypothetical protein
MDFALFTVILIELCIIGIFFYKLSELTGRIKKIKLAFHFNGSLILIYSIPPKNDPQRFSILRNESIECRSRTFVLIYNLLAVSIVVCPNHPYRVWIKGLADNTLIIFDEVKEIS